MSLLEHNSGDLNSVSPSESLPFEIVLDSGAVDHVSDSTEAPGYAVDGSRKSTANFSTANGDPIENRGQMTLNLTTTTGHPIQSVFQVCEVSRPLWSVSKICDAGCEVTFTKTGASIKHAPTGKEVCTFERKRGLYVASMPLRPPQQSAASQPTFSRQDRK